ncbi:MAG: molybdopterin molybdenumtransferase MoeA [Sulfurimonas sp. RIFOXYD12_FULL_33_39]|uniref:molybdopterin molybdotransferase MoeA n=1 Tax=unclassified Sulfurimonas TaxID=2623549 RepID=UPI0008CE4CC2|nr:MULTISPECIES: gephyrin-like molybdotransferase Glp [unclassified Sulfurimonas]OHE10357.1 MAG: molybdopterin molybdenumtransferase MoeA [Sulfurimonas sp. RIFOXYD12_FULL_33_39]OHE13068.1 MAG: molybdopterin molybdenumtransferase MoeA [Sulfurimonas sp. RIFOXYD2_FULL_34_21]DAB27955.1 MAG TPA: molybdopterin molybdenumtransferase MoeA [Sulfurimonas sp. UBA10385]
MSLLSYETSQNMLDLLHVNSSRSENIALSSSLGRVLAEDIVAEFNDPQFPTASMDGYAVIHTDLDGKSITILGDNPAGSNEIRTIKNGECIKTFTGSMMPHGADTLIQIENVSVNNGKITVDEKVPFGNAVRPIGEGYRAGDILIKKGTKIGFVEIGVMAALNKVMVKVALKPRVAVVSTGSEILDLGINSDNPSQIRSSNNYTLAALFEQSGAEVVQLGTVGDDKNSIMQTFQNALSCADILVSTGGVSVGDYDFVKDIVPRIGAEVVYKGVAIKPGKHILVAQKEEKFVLALPGFAYSSTVTAILYVLPLIAKMLGRDSAYKTVAAKLSEEFTKRSRLTEFTACNVVVEDGEYFVNFKDKKVGSSAILTNMLNSSALMITGEEDANLSKGTFVNVILLDNF